MVNAESPVGLFDSGVGGLSILAAVRRVLPQEDLVYFADQKYCPYGPRPADEIRALSARVTRFLLEQGCKAIVVACNTASAAALDYLRSAWPDTPFVGMEPAVKPAAEKTRSGKVGVLATAGTLNGELFQRTRNQHARDIEVLVSYPKDWVERVERGEIDSPETEASIRSAIQPFLDEGADEIALGCTHYPFLMPIIRRIAGTRAEVLDPSEAVARQTVRVLTDHRLVNPQTRRGRNDFYTSGDPLAFGLVLTKLLRETAGAQHADPLY